MDLTVLLPASAMITDPDGDMASDWTSFEKRAADPDALTSPNTPAAPATDVTTPAGVILRIRPLSLTYTLPDPSTVSPAGSVNRAAAPVPSVVPVRPALPASVVTTPAGVTLRTVLLTGSET